MEITPKVNYTVYLKKLLSQLRTIWATVKRYSATYPFGHWYALDYLACRYSTQTHYI